MTGLPTEQSGLTMAMPPPTVPNPPTAVVGSRLSLLARQLSAPPDGQSPLPTAPVPLSPDQLRGTAPDPVHQPQNRQVLEAAGAAMLQQNMRKGMGTTKEKKGGRGGLLAGLAATLLIGAVGYLGWQKREPLKEAIAGWLNSDKEPKIPATSVPSNTGLQPGVDPMPKGKVKVASADDGEHTPVPDETANNVAKVDKPTPPPVPETPAMPPVVGKQDIAPPPAPMPATVDTEPAPPRALPVDEDGNAASRTPMVADAGGKQPATDPGQPANPVVNPNQALVEVGRSGSTEPKPGMTSAQSQADAEAETGRPKAVGVPPEARPGFDGLVKFLSAASWTERVRYSMLPSQVEAKGRAYYERNPDGPIDVDEIHYLRHETNPQVGSGMHCVFVIFSRAWDDGIPVMVEVKDGEARVDWLTFVEFKDDMLHQFMNNPGMEGRWRFHVQLRRCHYFDDDVPDRENKDCFEVAPPMPGSAPLYAFTERSSQLARSLASTITWDKQVTWGIVELEWKNTNGTRWIELTAVPQLNWYSADAAADVDKAPTAVGVGSATSSTPAPAPSESGKARRNVAR